MMLIEAAEAPAGPTLEVEPLPRRVLALNGRTISYRLKDGRAATLTVAIESETELSVTAAVDGDWAGYVSMCANRMPPRPDDPDEGDQYAEDRGSWSATGLDVQPAYQRQGIATAMYDLLAKAGLKILPSGRHGGKLLPNGASLWGTNYDLVRRKGYFPQPKHHRFWKPSDQRRR